MRWPTVTPVYYPMAGGLDLVTPAITKSPGTCIDAQNYEPDPVSGYRRINGYERSDGRTSPTSASYWVISATITGALAVGNTLTGLTSAATGRVLAIDGTMIVLGRVSGVFQSGEALQVAGTTRATSTNTATENGASTPALNADYKLLAANDRRTDITTVPGSGIVRGGFVFADINYAFRDNLAGTAGDLYKESGAGWVKITFPTRLEFTGAVGEIADGAAITGATSGATATVVRAMLRTGTWTVAGAGTLILTGVTGTFTNGENIQVAAVTKVVANGASAAVTRAPGGLVETVTDNFGGTATTKRVYGADGVNNAFEFDGTYYIPIKTGMAVDTPTHVAVHAKRLWLTFAASLQSSGVAAPYSWTLLTGANEIGMGDLIAGILPVTGNQNATALGVFTDGRTSVLYGSSSATFQLIPSSDDLGYSARTLQSVGNDAYGLTARGIQSMVTTLNYGDFQFAALSVLVQPLLARKMGIATPTASVSLRTKNQYRVFFSDNTALVVGLTGGKVSGILPLNYGRVVRCMWSAKLSTGEEVTYFGSDDGYVYKDNIGTSFDGAAIEAWIRPAFNNLQSPLVRKQFRRAVFEVACDGYAQVNATYDLQYADPSAEPAAVQQDQVLLGAGGYWDQVNWDQFTWDAPVVADAQLSIDGSANNINFLFYSNRNQDDPHVVQGVSLVYTPRRLTRGGS